ncbi:MAG: hypothetical protein KKG75_05300 [Nanoarchaeota archaeon]|nr:hypothetical protein [Nanoarchaeota archaeon]
MAVLTEKVLDRILGSTGEFRDDEKIYRGQIRKGRYGYYLFIGEGLPEPHIPNGVELTIYPPGRMPRTGLVKLRIDYQNQFI